MMIKKIGNWLYNTNDITRSAYLWNSIAAMLNSFQTMLILLVITRLDNVADGGIFTIAYAVGNLMMTIGKYGMRNFQATDVKNRYSLKEYIYSRYISVIVMIISSAIYVIHGVLANGYSREKALVVVLICIVKLIEAFEDVLHGQMQQMGRLDVAGKILGVRLFFYIVSYILAYITTRNLVQTTIIALIITLILAVVMNKIMIPKFVEKQDAFQWNHVKELLFKCFPLFLSSFFIMYIANAPKYAIDAVLTEEVQACFNVIFMPVFVIALLCNFVFQPILTKLAFAWSQKDYKQFNQMVYKQMIIIVAITLVVAAGGGLLGTIVLGIVYKLSLNQYRVELIVLLLGGGMLALINLLNLVITTIRYQRVLIWGYAIVSAVFYLFGGYFVRHYGVLGISIFYTCLMSILAILFYVIMKKCIRKEIAKDKEANTKK